MRPLIIAVSCVAFLASSVAFASGVDDPDDTAGRLDIEYLGAHAIGNRLEFEVSMYEAWPTRLYREGRARVLLLFNTKGDRTADIGVFADYRRDGWHGEVCEFERRSNSDDIGVCSSAKVWRSEEDSIEFSVYRGQILERNENSYGWRAKTRLRFAKGCPDTGKIYCRDRAHGEQAD